MKIDPDKLILKMMDGNVVAIEGEDYDSLKQIFWHHTVNWEEERKENHKRHNQEDIPPPSDFSDNEDKHTQKATSQYCSNEDYGWIPIPWDMVEYLLENYRLDWEATTPDLDSLYESLKEAYNSYLRMYFPDSDEFVDEPSVDYGYDNSQSTDDDHLDIEPPTGIPFKPEDWEPKECDLDDDEIPI